ncbi:MAG: DUF3365 domain-containing protein [Candidatus Sedimenticola sp. (ex Thyasira tokunagai)]
MDKLSGQILIIFWFLVVVTSAINNIYLARSHAEEISSSQAETMFEHIVLTRSWNARHGGVYVPIAASTQPNPYLQVPDRDVVTEKGVKLTKINPAYMTRQVGELALESGGVQFHITSLDPIRPQNAPTPWERAALERFELGEKAVGEFLDDEQKYRYMAPLMVTKGCLKCHAEQGYKLGDIRGGISVTHSAEEILHNRQHTIVNTLVIHTLVLIFSIFSWILYRRSQRRMQSLRVEKEAAEQANTFKGAFIANISHELRTPLNAIIGMSHILNEDELKPSQRDHVQRISEAGKRLNSMINQMLDFSQIDAGAMELNLAPLQLRRPVQESVELMRYKAQKKGLSLSTEFQEGASRWLQGDALHLQQVLLHIIDNAIKFTQAGGVKVVVVSTPAGNRRYNVELRIEDSGIGMGASAERLRMHDFTQIENYRTRRRGGVGLGLTLSRKLLELMGGSLKIDSEVGRGTRVTVQLVLEGAEEAGRAIDKYPDVPEQATTSAPEHGPVVNEEDTPWLLTEPRRQQLNDQLSQLLAALDRDLPHAMDILTAMIEQYQGSECQEELISLSEKMANFDSDGVVLLGRSMQEMLMKGKL